MVCGTLVFTWSFGLSNLWLPGGLLGGLGPEPALTGQKDASAIVPEAWEGFSGKPSPYVGQLSFFVAWRVNFWPLGGMM